MRLLIPMLIILLGVACGLAVSKLFPQSEHNLKASLVAGGVGAFVGLMLRDILDDTSGGLLGGALLFAILGATTLSLIVNVAVRYFRR